jgi:hypothetical protein
MQRFPADAVMAIDRTPRSAGDAMPDRRMRPSFLLSIWINSPGLSRS